MDEASQGRTRLCPSLPLILPGIENFMLGALSVEDSPPVECCTFLFSAGCNALGSQCKYTQNTWEVRRTTHRIRGNVQRKKITRKMRGKKPMENKPREREEKAREKERLREKKRPRKTENPRKKKRSCQAPREDRTPDPWFTRPVLYH